MKEFDTEIGTTNAKAPSKSSAFTYTKPSNMNQTTSTLEHQTDPFAKREGKTLVWKEVNMTLATSGKDSKRKLLQGVWGEVPPGETTAPSGAGKSSLLNILAGRACSQGRLTFDSDIRLNNYTVDPTNTQVRQTIAFVAQDDSLQATAATPREAIRFSAKLRLPCTTKESQIEKLVRRMITELGLTSCADTIVGGELIKGISGGERNRTNVGVELLTKPASVFLDEPTSGLDSFSAVQQCQVLKKVANSSASVLFTIHQQPSSKIVNAFDRLILMNKGRDNMYQGPVQQIPDNFAERGQQANPKNDNPADWIMHGAQTNSLKNLHEADFSLKEERILGDPLEADELQDSHLDLTFTTSNETSKEERTLVAAKPPVLLTQTRLLLFRGLFTLLRDTNVVRWTIHPIPVKFYKEQN